ncbi:MULTISPECIES: DUF3618 domain-containing protein [unclassified Streptomyces]|uniref:DUF3618 domain-containing protein n=1 Tax=Streptomyces sp. TN58 TaxID=234612 RepID=UPI0004AB98EF|nr:DUF3618 domain-containing protein [Streptomyces sp. TN58]
MTDAPGTPGTPDAPRTPDDAGTDSGTPTPDELREQVERTRDELGQTIEALAGKADVKAQAKEKTAQVADRIHDKAAHTAQRVHDATPDPVLDAAGRVASTARANPKPLLMAGAALLVVLLVWRSRACR